MKRLLATFIAAAALSACSSGGEQSDSVTSTSTSTTRVTVPETSVPDTTTSTTLPEDNLPSNESEIVPTGKSVEVGGWKIEVLNVNLNATQVVVEANQFNKPPAEGERFVLAEVKLTYDGEELSVPADLTYHAVGPDGTLYDEFDAACGVIPAPLDQFEEVEKGGEVTGNLCWSVSNGHVDGLMLVVSPVFNEEATSVFLSLSPVRAEPAPTTTVAE